MKIVIIEDEIQTAWDIETTLKALRPAFTIVTILDSVESSVDWLSRNPMPDLIISDIQLGDGLSFEIFKNHAVTCPIIFCTAFDEYAIDAFKTNGIAYILKPINETEFEKSLLKLESMVKTIGGGLSNIDALEKLLLTIYHPTPRHKTSFLVSFRNQLIPVQTDDILMFKISDSGTEIFTRQNQKHTLAKTLDSLESLLDPINFHRANRQYIVNFSAISQVEHFDERKLLIKIKGLPSEHVVVSKAKASDFIRWMEDR